MSSKLEIFIKENVDKLDVLEPSNELWKNIEAHSNNGSFVKSHYSWLKYFAFGISVLVLVLYFKLRENKKTQSVHKNKISIQVKSNENGIQKEIKDTQSVPLALKEVNVKQKINLVVSDKEEKKSIIEEPASLSEFPSQIFEKLANADSRYALIISDSIYGPTNVSVGYGSQLEFKIDANKRVEKNSAWFKFTVSKTGWLTFDIVPKLGTDDYDFALFKCDAEDCQFNSESNGNNPVRMCFSWNTSQSSSTGLSNIGFDTTYEAMKGSGPSYASGLKVKRGDKFYLLVNTSLQQRQDPEGFMIYFYNNWSKRYQKMKQKK